MVALLVSRAVCVVGNSVLLSVLNLLLCSPSCSVKYGNQSLQQSTACSSCYGDIDGVLQDRPAVRDFHPTVKCEYVHQSMTYYTRS